MGLFKLSDLDFSRIVQKVIFLPHSTSVKNEQEELQERLNNVGLETDQSSSYVRSANTSRVMSKEVQYAIKKFNSCSTDEKNEILDLADDKLKDKLIDFMNKNADFMNIEDDLTSEFKLIYEDIESVASRGHFGKEEIENLVERYEQIRNNAIANGDNVIDAFTEYGTDSQNNEIGNMIKSAGQFKQAVLSYSLIFESKIRELINSKNYSTKQELLKNLSENIAKIQAESQKFHANASDQMNSFIPNAIQTKNQFYGKVSKYIKSELPMNFNLENKEYETAFIDALLESLNYNGANLYG